MNTLPNLTLGQDGTDDDVFQGLTALDYVFDEFLAAESLALILSPSHMVRAMLRMSTQIDRNSSQAIESIINNPSALTQFHMQLLEKVSGFHVQEASIEEVDQLILALDERYDEGWAGDELEFKLSERFLSMPKPQLTDYCNSAMQYLAFYQKGHWQDARLNRPH